MNHYYRHSGKFSIGPALAGLLVSGVAASVLAYMYAIAILHIHNPYFRGTCAVMFGCGAGIVAGYVLTKAKVRSNFFAALAGCAAGLAGLYASWGVWLHEVLGSFGVNLRAGQMLSAPASMWNMAGLVNAIGTWSIVPGVHSRGPELWLAWTLEAAAILGAAALASVFMMDRSPFCESCQGWCESKQALHLSPVIDPEELRARLEKGDFTTLYAMPHANARDEHLRLQMHVCRKCGNFNTVSLSEKMKRGPFYDRNHVFSHLMLSADEAQYVYNLDNADFLAESRHPVAV